MFSSQKKMWYYYDHQKNSDQIVDVPVSFDVQAADWICKLSVADVDDVDFQFKDKYRSELCMSMINV